MAEVGASAVSKGAFSKASGDADEIFCDPCCNGGQNVAVDGYCQTCEEYMCRNCLKLHRNQKISRGHQIADINQIQPKPKVGRGREECIEVCETHHPEIIRFYCKAHDETGCVNCMVENHANCTKEWIQDIADGFQATEEFKELHQKLESFHTKLGEMKETISENLEHIGSTFETIEQKIESFRGEINAYLDQIQKKLTDEVLALRKEKETPLKEMSTVNGTLKAEVESIIQKFQNDDNVNSSFILAKQTHKRLNALQKQFDNTQQKEKQEQLKQLVFHPSPDIARILSSKVPLGTLTKIPDISRITASYKRSINLKSSKESNCWINGCVLLEPNKMVVTDGNNNKIKLVDIENDRILFGYKTCTRPDGITRMASNVVAVSLPDEALLLLLNVHGTITTRNVIKLNYSGEECGVVAYKHGLFAVAYKNPGRLKVLDTGGEVLHTVKPQLENEDLLHDVYGIQFGHSNDTLIVTDDETDKVSVVSFNGEILHTYTHDTMISPGVIAVTGDGIVFVNCYGNECIHAVSPDFKSSKIIIENEERLPKPFSIAYCEMNRRLYISNCIDDCEGGDKRNNLLHVFELSNM